MSDHAGVLNLAGEFVHSYYQLVVSDQFAGAVDFYSENAVLTRGIGGTRATSSQSVAAEVHAMHSKLKEGTTEIVSIDAVQLESQNIVITVAVAFKSINTVVAQTLVLEAKADEDGQALWFIVNDMLRYLPSNALVGASAAKGGSRGAAAASGDKPKAKNVAAKPAVEAAKPAEENSATPAAVVAAPAVVTAPVAAPVVAAPVETKVESAPVAVQTHVTKPKTENRGKKTATTADKPATAAATTSHASAAAEKPAAPKKEEPKTWAARAAAAASAAPSSAASTEENKPAVVAAAPAATAVPVVAEEKPHRHANVVATATGPAATTAPAASNDLHIFIRAPAAITPEAIREKFAAFGATVVDVEVKAEKSAIVALQTEDKEALFNLITSAGPIAINGATLSSIEKSRSAPNARSSTGGSRGGSRGGRSSPSSSSSPATSSSNGRDAPRGGRRPAGGASTKRD